VQQKTLLIREVQHRVMNSLQLLSSFLHLQSRQIQVSHWVLAALGFASQFPCLAGVVTHGCQALHWHDAGRDCGCVRLRLGPSLLFGSLGPRARLPSAPAPTDRRGGQDTQREGLQLGLRRPGTRQVRASSTRPELVRTALEDGGFGRGAT
jgi:hypothetical protein